LALRRHRLPRFWLAITLGSVVAAIGLGYWWERQLPRRLEKAASSGQLDDCLRYSEQLAALSWLPGRSPLDRGRCLRAKADQLWQQENWAEALRLQRQVINSRAGSPSDRQRLARWQHQLRSQAKARFKAGDLQGALAALTPLGEDRNADGSALGDELQAVWNRNRLQLERAGQLVKQQRWWEALDSLNRIDHPWWRQQSDPLREQVKLELEKLKGKDREHDSHGSLPHTVSGKKLDALVQRRITAGMDEWKAFQEACRELGGRVVEAGPESACQR
jgi:tetratricopeptide (TPR) repeat protein